LKSKKESKGKVRKAEIKTQTAKDLGVTDQKGRAVKGGAKCAAFPGSQGVNQANCGAIFSRG
jgi:hypothetical protein